MKDHPSLLPVDELGISGPLLVVGRETPLASGSIDLVGVVPSGDMVLVEFKTGPENPDFRHALAQLIDYGSDLWGISLADFEEGVVRRYTSSRWCPAEYRGITDLHEIGARVWGQETVDWERFDARLGDVLTTGDFHYVVAAQRFTPQMTRSLDYLNEMVRWGKYHLVQMIHLVGDMSTAYSAQSVSGVSKPRRGAGSSATSEAEFLASVGDGPYKDALEGVFSTCTTLGLSFEWGSRGTSIRLPTPDRSEPISIGWAFPEGRNWYGLRHLSLGYDRASARQTPSVLPSLERYVERLGNVPHAVRATGKTLDAWTWGPQHLPEVRALLVEALEQLVSEAGGD
jgi:hypothetical protein